MPKRKSIIKPPSIKAQESITSDRVIDINTMDYMVIYVKSLDIDRFFELYNKIKSIMEKDISGNSMLMGAGFGEKNKNSNINLLSNTPNTFLEESLIPLFNSMGIMDKIEVAISRRNENKTEKPVYIKLDQST